MADSHSEGSRPADKNAFKPKIKFSSKIRNNIRKRRNVSDSDSDKEDAVDLSIIEGVKELRKLRKRTNGVDALTLAVGGKAASDGDSDSNDPFKLKTGGMLDLKNLRGKRSGVEELDAVTLGSTFSAETNQRDEDAIMMKYIEEELAKKKGLKNAENDEASKPVPKVDDVFFDIPEHLRRSSSKKSEEMLSNQMLSGIPEVDLGIHERIRNIEATEEAKLRLLNERRKKKEKAPSFVPTNMAVNFVQHNRFNLEEGKVKKPVEAKPAPVVVIGESDLPRAKGQEVEKATDDFHFEKFKKQFRRH